MAADKPDYLEYDWRLDGEPAHFLVDLSLYDRGANGDYPVLAFVGCSSGDNKGLGKPAEMDGKHRKVTPDLR